MLNGFAIRSRRVVTPAGIRAAAIMIERGKIVEVVSSESFAVDAIDYGDLVISPGLVDTHVHINEPGRTDWEGFETATRAAAAGGITSLIEMPLNSHPVTTSNEALEVKLKSTEGKLFVDCGFHAGVIPKNAASLGPLLSAGVFGVKAFLIHSGIDEFPHCLESDLRTAMPILAQKGLPLLVHAELNTGDQVQSPTSSRHYRDFLGSRPRKWENDAVDLMIRLCEEFGCRVHIVHVSSSEIIPKLRQAKQRGLPITAETCPHYLVFSSENILDGATQFKCAPPIREQENNDQLWEALREGVIDFVVSDHSPCPPEMKLPNSGDFMNAWGGISSLQFGLSIVWTEARKRGCSIEDLNRWMSASPAKLAGLENSKGAIDFGRDADIVVWDPEATFTIREHDIFHRHKLTPYLGQTVAGKVHTTYVRGCRVFENGQFSTPIGRALLRQHNTSQHKT